MPRQVVGADSPLRSSLLRALPKFSDNEEENCRTLWTLWPHIFSLCRNFELFWAWLLEKRVKAYSETSGISAGRFFGQGIRVCLPLVSREWKNGRNSSYNCTPVLHSLLTKGKFDDRDRSFFMVCCKAPNDRRIRYRPNHCW